VTKYEQTEIKENIDWFKDNDNYITAQANLEYYRHIELMIRREIQGEKEVLDVGNGGFFKRPTTELPGDASPRNGVVLSAIRFKSRFVLGCASYE